MVHITSCEEGKQIFDYATLCRQQGIVIGIPGNPPGHVCRYRTTGARTVICASSGKEYPLVRSLLKRNGCTVEHVSIHHTDVDVWTPIPESAHAVEPLPEQPRTIPDTAFYDQTRLPTREQVFAALHFYGENPDTVHDVCAARDIFEIMTEEYVSALARYLADRIGHLRLNGNPLTILEVGAGDGKLTQTLREKLHQLNVQNIRMIAADSQEWNIKPTAPVERMGYEEALQAYGPQIVLCSWMPPSSDWSFAFRATPSVQEYVLIGEPDGALCGDLWKTWGKLPRRAYPKNEPPPYRADHFERVNLSELSQLQLCRFDLGDVRRSATVSWRRSPPQTENSRAETEMQLH